MPQEADVVLGIEAKVIDAVFKLTDAFDPHSEGEAGIFAAVDPEVVEHFGMDHAAAEDLNPSGMFADAAAYAAADTAIDIHFGAGFREGEIGRAEADANVFAEHFLHKEIQGLFKIREGDVLVHIQTFGLMEEAVCPGADGFIPVDATGADDADGRTLLFHRAGLDAAGVGTQQPIGMLMDIKGILHVPGGVIFREIQRGEIVPVVFDLGTFGHGKTQSAEDMHDLVADEGDRMMGTEGNGIAGETEVGGIAFFSDAAKVLFPILIFCFSELFEIVQDLAERLLLIAGHIFHFGEEVLYNTLCAKEADAVGFQRVCAIGGNGCDLLFVLVYLF